MRRGLCLCFLPDRQAQFLTRPNGTSTTKSFEDIAVTDYAAAPPVQEPESSARPASASRLLTMVACASLLGVLAIYVMRLDRVVGLFVDDGWYVLLAKALATGQGYALLNSPTPGILPLYPPAFPFLLSLMYRLSPNFPDNLWLLKSVSIAAMMGVGLLAYRYFARERGLGQGLALLLALAAVLSPPLVFLATSTMMSECVFALIFLATVVLAEKCRQAGNSARGLQLAAFCGALAAVGFLTRSIALALIAAGFLYLLKERLVKSALVFGAVAVLLAAPWVMYTRLHTPTPEQQKEQGGHIVLPYTQQFWQRRAGFNFSGSITVADLPARVWNNAVEISGRDVGRIVLTPLFEALRDPYKEAQSERVKAGGSGDTWSISFLLSLVAVVGLLAAIRQRITMAELAVPFSLGITVLWPWETFRFVLPLIPFVIFYFLVGVKALAALVQRKQTEARAPQLAVAVIAGLVVAVNLYGNLTYLAKKLSETPSERPQWLQIFDDAEGMMIWVNRNVPKTDAIATANPPLVYLYTGNKTVAADDPAANWDNWNRLGVRYLVRASVYPEPPDPSEQKFSLVYRARGFANFRVIDLGPPNARPTW